ncbi:hypothetical protein V502_04594, partial [Pseudogymnoascus sp. VKM F-4520 (FW-2644)]
MDTTTTNPGGHSPQTATPQQENNTPMPSADLTSIPGLGAIPGLGSATPTAAPAQTSDTTHPAPSTDASAGATSEVTTETRDEGPSVTNALEAMLGGLSPEGSTGTMTADTPLQAAPVAEVSEDTKMEDTKMEDTKMEDSHTEAAPTESAEATATAPSDAAMMDYIPPTTTPGP